MVSGGYCKRGAVIQTPVAAACGGSAVVDFDVAVRRDRDGAVVTVSGEIDVYSAPQLRQALVDVISTDARDVTVDLDGVSFMDSSGLGVLVGAWKRVRATDGSLRLVCSRELILKTFRITGLTKVFSIYPSMAEASLPYQRTPLAGTAEACSEPPVSSG
jgi:anti-sigma B factor antagonist